MHYKVDPVLIARDVSYSTISVHVIEELTICEKVDKLDDLQVDKDDLAEGVLLCEATFLVELMLFGFYLVKSLHMLLSLTLSHSSALVKA